MVNFRQKVFSEYENTIILYNLIKQDFNLRNRIKVIDSSALPSILRGNNVVIEKFTISTSLFNKDKYMMYLKMGAKVKLPSSIRLDGTSSKTNIGSMSVSFRAGLPKVNASGGGQRMFGEKDKKDDKKKKSGGGGGGGDFVQTSFNPYSNLEYEYTETLGRVVRYNKIERSLVLEFDSKVDALRALNVLPFGLDYNLYLLDR